MFKLRVCLLFAGFALINSCQQNNPANNTDTLTDLSANYIDFKYSKVIAFATVDPFDSPSLRNGNTFPNFHDTISRTLDSLQIIELNEVLSGRKGIVPESSDVADCFSPRHNIIFLDSSENVLHYLAICFECNRRKTSKPTTASMKSLLTFFNSVALPVFERPDWHKQYYDSIAKQKQ